MPQLKSYRDLVAWKKSYEFAVEVYRETQSFPANERFGLTIQLRRAAVSIPSNIAEGQGRGSKADFVRFLAMARGSLFEVETQLSISSELGYLERGVGDRLLRSAAEIGRILNGLIASLK